jgi:hypothetical protein
VSIENPVDTVIRLLKDNVRVEKADGSPANITVSREWVNQEALQKSVDGQITVGLLETVDNKLELTGRLRRRLVNLRVNVWSLDPQLRFKMVEEVNRVIRRNRVKPTDFLLDFYGVNRASGTHKAYKAAVLSDLPPNDSRWTELLDANYELLWQSDDRRYEVAANSLFPMMLFRFKINAKETSVRKIVLLFEGYGTCPYGNGVSIRVWNHVAQAWQHLQSSYSSSDATLTIALTSNISDYIDDNGYVWLLAKTIYAGTGVSSILYCDYVSCVFAVHGLSYVDVASYRDLDRVDVKPFLYRTEFVLKSWVLEDIGV